MYVTMYVCRYMYVSFLVLVNLAASMYPCLFQMFFPQTALSKGCRRLHWAVLDWNTSSVELYKRRGGINLTEKEGWHLFRMTKPSMEEFVTKYEVKS